MSKLNRIIYTGISTAHLKEGLVKVQSEWQHESLIENLWLLKADH